MKPRAVKRRAGPPGICETFGELLAQLTAAELAFKRGRATKADLELLQKYGRIPSAA